MFGSINKRAAVPISKGQPVVAKVVIPSGQTLQTISMSPQTLIQSNSGIAPNSNILVVGQARALHPNNSTNLVVPGGSSGFLIEKNSPNNVVMATFQQQQQLQQQIQHQLQQQQLQQLQQNVASAISNASSSLNSQSSTISPVQSIYTLEHSQIPSVSSRFGIIRNRLPSVDNTKIALQPLQTVKANVIPMAKSQIQQQQQQHQQQPQLLLPTSSTSLHVMTFTTNQMSLTLQQHQPHQQQTLSSSSSSSSSIPPYSSTITSASIITNNLGSSVSQRLWLPASKTTYNQVQQRSVGNVTLRSSLPVQQQQQQQLSSVVTTTTTLLIASSSSSSSCMPNTTTVTTFYPLRNVPSANFVDFNNLPQHQLQQQISLSVGTVHPIIRPTNIIYQQQPKGILQQQQQINKTLLSPTIPINLSASTFTSTASSINKVNQTQALNLTQTVTGRPVILTSPVTTKSTVITQVNLQSNSFIPQTPLNLSKQKKVKLQPATTTTSMTATLLSLATTTFLPTSQFSIASAFAIAPNALKPIVTMFSLPNNGSQFVGSQSSNITTLTSLPMAKVNPQQLQIMSSVSGQPQFQQQQQQLQQQQLQQQQQQSGQHLTHIQIQPQQFMQLQQQQQQQHLLTTSAIRNMTSNQTGNIISLQSASTMLLGGNYNIIQSGALTAGTLTGSNSSQGDKPQIISVSDVARFLSPQTTHINQQTSQSVVQAIMIPSSVGAATQRPGPSSVIGGGHSNISLTALTFPTSTFSSTSSTLHLNPPNIFVPLPAANNIINNNNISSSTANNKVLSVCFPHETNTSNVQQNFTFITAPAECVNEIVHKDLQQQQPQQQQPQQQQPQPQQQPQQQQQQHFPQFPLSSLSSSLIASKSSLPTSYFNMLPASSMPSSSSSSSTSYNSNDSNSANSNIVNNNSNISNINNAVTNVSTTINNIINNSNNTGNTPNKQQNQSPRPPILRKRTHETSLNNTKKNLFSSSSSVMSTPTSTLNVNSSTSISTLTLSGMSSALQDSNLQHQQHSFQQQQQQLLRNIQHFTTTVADVVARQLGANVLSNISNNSAANGHFQFAVPISPKISDSFKETSHPSGQIGSVDRNKTKLSKVSVASNSNRTYKVQEGIAAMKSMENDSKVNSRKKPRKQTFAQKQQTQLQSNLSPDDYTGLQCKETIALEGLTSDEENDDEDECDGLVVPAVVAMSKDVCHDSNEDPQKENLKDFNDGNHKDQLADGADEYVDEFGHRWTEEKVRSRASLSHQYQCTWKPRNNHFVSYNDFKLKEEKKMTVNDLANQRGIIQKLSGYKLYLVAGHFDELKKDEEDILSELVELKTSLSLDQGYGAQNVAVETNGQSNKFDTLEDLRSIDDLILANEQRSRKCIEQCDELQTMLLKIMNGKSKAGELIYKHQSKRAVKKKDRC